MGGKSHKKTVQKLNQKITPSASEDPFIFIFCQDQFPQWNISLCLIENECWKCHEILVVLFETPKFMANNASQPLSITTLPNSAFHTAWTADTDTHQHHIQLLAKIQPQKSLIKLNCIYIHGINEGKCRIVLGLPAQIPQDGASPSTFKRKILNFLI